MNHTEESQRLESYEQLQQALANVTAERDRLRFHLLEIRSLQYLPHNEAQKFIMAIDLTNQALAAPATPTPQAEPGAKTPASVITTTPRNTREWNTLIDEETSGGKTNYKALAIRLSQFSCFLEEGLTEANEENSVRKESLDRMGRELQDQFEELAAARREVNEVKAQAFRLLAHEGKANRLYTNLRNGNIPPEDGTGLIDEVRTIMTQRDTLRREVEELKVEVSTSNKALAYIKDAVRADEDFDADEIVKVIEDRVGRYSMSLEWLASKALQEEVHECRDQVAAARREADLQKTDFENYRRTADGLLKRIEELKTKNKEKAKDFESAFRTIRQENDTLRQRDAHVRQELEKARADLLTSSGPFDRAASVIAMLLA